MRSNWKFFIPALLFGGYLLISRGAPLAPVLLGCAAAALANIVFARRSRSRPARPGQ